jgi:hypothetical protein
MPSRPSTTRSDSPQDPEHGHNLVEARRRLPVLQLVQEAVGAPGQCRDLMFGQAELAAPAANRGAQYARPWRGFCMITHIRPA